MNKTAVICRKLFFERPHHPGVQFMRSFYIGALATVLDIALLLFLKEYLHIYYLLAAGIGYIAGLITNYLLSNKWAFDYRLLEKRKFLEFSIFFAITLAGLVFLEIIMWVFTSLFGLYYLLSKVIATLLVFIWNFTARKIILYSKYGQ